MKKSCLIILIIAFSMSVNYAQTNNTCACCDEDHSSFDFWEGDWTVYGTNGQIIGTNKVLKMQDNCVLQENWLASNSTNTGTSYNYFDKSDATWNQIWISNTGNVLNLKGNLNDEGAMVLKSPLVKGTNGNFYNQISWTQNSDGSVTQRWDILNENHEPISSAFEGIYKKSTD